ncbi:hypothetical protein ABNF65_21510, partial [Paenibacillus larvae]
EGYEYGSFHFLEPSFLHNYTDSTVPQNEKLMVGDKVNVFYQVATMSIPPIASPITIEKISE